MTNPWMVPLLMSSANVIAMRSWMLWPADGRHDAWQRREAARMVAEKVDAAREAQMEALALAWRMWFAPWSLWTPGPGVGLQRSIASATDAVVRPFSRRAAANAKRLQARALEPMVRAWPALAAAGAAPAPASRGRGRRSRRG